MEQGRLGVGAGFAEQYLPEIEDNFSKLDQKIRDQEADIGRYTLNRADSNSSQECPKKWDKKEEKAFDVVLDTRKFEIELFWKRSLFFWGFIAIAFVLYGTAKDKLSGGVLPLGITSFGLICSWCWHLVNRGSKYWQENWEKKVTRYEQVATGENLFKDKECRQEKKPWSAWKYSVGKITLFLSLYTTLIWLGLFLNECGLLWIKYDIWPSDYFPDWLFTQETKAKILAFSTAIALLFLTFTTYTSFEDKPVWYIRLWKWIRSR